MHSILFFIICALHAFGLKNNDKFSNEKSLQVGCAHELRALLSLSRMAKSNKMSNVHQKKTIPSKSNMVSHKMIFVPIFVPIFATQSLFSEHHYGHWIHIFSHWSTNNRKHP